MGSIRREHHELTLASAFGMHRPVHPVLERGGPCPNTAPFGARAATAGLPADLSHRPLKSILVASISGSAGKVIALSMLAASEARGLLA